MSQIREDDVFDSLPPRVQTNGSQAPSSTTTLLQASDSAPIFTIDRRKQLAGWLAVAFILLLQWLLFHEFALREILWGYPIGFDQLSYLARSYEAYDQMLGHGLWAGWQHVLTTQAPQGVMLELQASLMFLLLGPTRLSAMTLNFIYFALFEGVLVAALRWLSRAWSVAFLGLGLLLTTISRFYWGGGLMDFRLDLINFSLFGISICAVIRSGLFQSRRWSLVVGAVAALAVLFRYLTIVYLIGVFGLVFVFLCIRWWSRRLTPARQAAAAQLLHLILAGLAVVAITFPFLWYSRAAIKAYYVVGHVTGSEPLIRARQTGTVDPTASLLYYPQSIYHDHAGPGFFLLSGLLLVVASAFWLVRRKRGPAQHGATAAEPAPPARPLPDLPGIAFFVFACLAAPLLILTMNVAKSPIVGSVTVPALVWLVVLGLLVLLRRYGHRPVDRIMSGLTVALAVAAIGSGLYTEFDRATALGVLTPHRAGVEQVLGLFNRVGELSRQMNWKAPRIAVDRTYDFIHPALIEPLAFEQQHVVLRPRSVLGGSIFAVTQEQALAAIQETDFAILTTASSRNEQNDLPFNESMKGISPALIAWAEQHLVPLERFHFFGQDVALYIRPALSIQRNSGEWITSDGVSLVGLTDVLRARPVVEMQGQAPFQYLSKVPAVSATIRQADGSVQTIPATLTRSQGKYNLKLTLTPANLPPGRFVEIRLAFDTYFVPKTLGLNADTRKLVLRIPDSILFQDR